MLSTPLLGALIAALTWPITSLAPAYGLDPSWIAGLYMAADRGMDAGTQIVFSYGPLGFLGLPALYEVGLGRIAFVWFGLFQVAFCVSMLWATRRAFGLPVALVVTTFAAVTPFDDPILVAVAVLGAAALLDDWSPNLRLGFAAGVGALAGMQLLSSLRAGPALIVMGAAVLIGLPDRRRNFAAFAGSLLLMFALLWFGAGQGLGNLDDYAINTLSVVSGYSSAMVFLEPSRWWQLPAFIVGLATIAVLCAAAVWHRDNWRRLGLTLMFAALVFLMFKHAVVRGSPGNAGVFVAILLTISLALVPHVRRPLAIGAVVVLIGLVYVGNRETLESRLELQPRAEAFVEQVKTVSLPGRAEEERQRGREAMQALYALTPEQLALARSGTVHVAGWEAGAAWAYGLAWDPLPIFQQYTAYTERLDELNAEKLESSSAPDLILWENGPKVDPAFGAVIAFPGAIDARWPAWDSPAQMVAMLCRYRAVQWDERWAVLRRSRDRCDRERPLRTVVAANDEVVPMPRTAPDEALIVRVDGLAVSGVERLRTLFFRAASRGALLGDHGWNVVGATAGDGLLLRVPSWADYPGYFALDSGASTIGFKRFGGFMTGVDSSTEFTLRFSALPLDAPAVPTLDRRGQKRRAQRSSR